jgi:hypothetical protein
LTEATRAREQVRGLLGLGNRERDRLETRLASIRDAVCRTHLGWRKGRPRKVCLSLLVFDESRGITRVVCTTTDGPHRKVELPWGAGVVGWVMRRRRPSFVDTSDRGTAGIYRPVPGSAEERYLLCVPLPLPSDSDRRSELLFDPSIPCVVVTLSCVDDSGNMERLKGSKAAENTSPGVLVGAVASDLAEKVLDIITRESF